MANNLFSLFDDKLKQQQDLVASPPQNLESISESEDDQQFVLRKLSQFEQVRPKVDYSDFSHFVFFNSALDYFNTTGEKIINEYPYDGSREQVEAFLDDFDDYQKYVINIWPKNTGHLRFNPAVSSSYIQVNDYGVDSNVGGSRAGLLSPATSSLSIDFWIVPPPALTGSNDVMVVLQRISGSDDKGYTVFLSGSRLNFRISSGSNTSQVSAAFSPGASTYFACIYDNDIQTLTLMSGSSTEFPVVIASASVSPVIGSLYLNDSKLYIGSGSISTKVVRPLSASLDVVKLWSTARRLEDVSASFNVKQLAQTGLVASWGFNESGSIPFDNSLNRLVRDSSGHRLDGTINNYYTAIRGSGSLIPFDSPDLILFFDAPEIQALVAEQQTSGTAYDRENDNAITRLLPDQFFTLEEFKNTDVLQKFLYILARNFDFLKIRIDQFVNVMRTNYGQFDQAPDALLEDVARFFGWEFTGNFLNADAFQYIIGKNVLQNLEANRELDTKLFQIKNEFWKRMLINLMYLYKTKGTRESVEACLRIYGINKNFVRLKEYGYKPDVGLSTFRIAAEKSIAALTFGSGTTSGTSYVKSNLFSAQAQTVEARVRFPQSSTPELPATVDTGSIWALNTGSLTASMVYQLYYVKDSATSLTGSLFFTSSEGLVSLTGAPIFDNRWYNIATSRDSSSGTLRIEVRALDRDTIDVYLTSSLSASIVTSTRALNLWLGTTGSYRSQYWEQEVRVWDQVLGSTELDDHTLNFQSFGTDEADGNSDLRLHWRLAEHVSASSAGLLNGQIVDVSGRNVIGSGSGFIASTNPYRKFLNDYNYIASPEFGWNEEKIRVLASPQVKPADAFLDNPTLALEFNMVDALNEDISQIIATMDNFNNFIGMPANRYRATYADLEMLRKNYFKRLSGRLNFRVFADMLEFFDMSFVDMVRRLLPARAQFLGAEFVVESHMLERPKLQWNYRRQERHFQPEGRIKIYVRT